MKKLFFLLFMSFFYLSLSAQTFDDVYDVSNYLRGKTFELKLENGNSTKFSFQSFYIDIKLWLTNSANESRPFSTIDNKKNITILSSTRAWLAFYASNDPNVSINIIVDCYHNILIDRESGFTYHLAEK